MCHSNHVCLCTIAKTYFSQPCEKAQFWRAGYVNIYMLTFYSPGIYINALKCSITLLSQESICLIFCVHVCSLAASSFNAGISLPVGKDQVKTFEVVVILYTKVNILC